MEVKESICCFKRKLPNNVKRKMVSGSETIFLPKIRKESILDTLKYNHKRRIITWKQT